MAKVDDILMEIGEFGPFQWRVFAIVCFVVFTNPWVSIIAVFLNASMDHWCTVSHWDDYDCTDVGLTADACVAAKRNASIPFNFSADGGLVYEQCHKYNTSGVNFWPGLSPSNYSTGSDDVIPCDQGWTYDTSQYKSSIVSDFDLVCGKEGLTDLAQSIFYGGFLAGSIVFGTLADMFGRWRILMFSLSMRMTCGIVSAFAASWWQFATLRFFQGATSISCYIISFVIGTEFVGPSKRGAVGMAFAVPFALGYMLLAAIAYFIRSWRTLQLAVNIPTVFIIVLVFFLPESLRWQIAARDFNKAEKTLSKVAETNKKHLNRPVFSQEFIKERMAAPKVRRRNGLDIFRTPNMRLRSINLIFIWMVNSMVYHGLSLNSSNLGVNIYLAFAVAGAVEIPAYLLAVPIINTVGRRPSLSGCMLLGGLACLCTSFISPSVALSVVAMVGKFGISASYGIIYLYTAELYPTEIRSVGVGTCSMFARVAGILAPLILALRKVWTPLPLVLYGSVSVLAGLLCLMLPETRGQMLPESMNDGENFGK
ncbi:organic cation transporter protein-like [Diadema setosum]|uniref:organic cation transporter protein-like n=1 Tax=Diadema setosum TaxID=31175 RepID=UPI003B3BDA92